MVVSVGVCQGRNVIAGSVSLSNFELSERLPGSAWPWQNLWISISRPTLRPILMQTRKLSFPPFHLPHDLGSSQFLFPDISSLAYTLTNIWYLSWRENAIIVARARTLHG